jgi:CRP-like cAMP-binding protein
MGYKDYDKLVIFVTIMFEVFQKYLANKITLTDEEYALIQSVCTFKKLRKKQYLLQEGDIWKYNAFVCEGCLRTYRVDDKGAEHILYFSIENWWTGDRESLTSGKPSKSNIDAIENAVVLLIINEDFEALKNKIPAFRDLTESLIEKSFAASQNRIHAVMSQSVEERYLNFINDYPAIANRVPQHMLASYLGISAETLSRTRNTIMKK